MMKEEIYLSDGYSSLDEVKEDVVIWDASRLRYVAENPRYFYYRAELGLKPREDDPTRMYAGIALHAALDYYYVTEDRDGAFEELFNKWEELGGDPPASSDFSYLNIGHLEIVLRNYFEDWIDSGKEWAKPLVFAKEDLNLDDVIAAKWRVTDDGRIVLGESSLLMRFEVDGEELVLAGKPDLPVMRKNTKNLYIMDHKTTSSYLSGYWFRGYRADNKNRGYMAMIKSLIGRPVHGFAINGVYVGKSATSERFGGTRSARRIYDFTKGHVEEALRNQLTWTKQIERFREDGYWPQSCAIGCRNCAYGDLCESPPELRDYMIESDYVVDRFDFFEI